MTSRQPHAQETFANGSHALVEPLRDVSGLCYYPVDCRNGPCCGMQKWINSGQSSSINAPQQQASASQWCMSTAQVVNIASSSIYIAFTIWSLASACHLKTSVRHEAKPLDERGAGALRGARLGPTAAQRTQRQPESVGDLRGDHSALKVKDFQFDFQSISFLKKSKELGDDLRVHRNGFQHTAGPAGVGA